VAVNNPSSTGTLDELCVNTIRTLAIDGVQQANSGHPGAPLGLAEAAYVLWTRFLKHNPQNPNWPDRDRFVLSAGHASMLLYSLLYLTGYDLSLDEIKHFRQWESLTPGHPEYGLTPGVETTTGPLGQGIGTAVGMAIAEAHLAATFNRPGHTIVDHYTYVIASDGDMMEGISHEACAVAGHFKLGKLIVLYDANHVMLSGPTNEAFSEDVGQRFTGYGWHVQTIDGMNRDEVAQALSAAQANTEQPSIIIAHTHIGFGSPKQDSFKSHGEPLGVEDVKKTKEKLGWPTDETFFVPQPALDHMRECVAQGQQQEAEWQNRFSAYAAAYPELATRWTEQINGVLPASYDATVPTWNPSEKAELSTREASGIVLNAIASKLPSLMGGSADLAPSNKTEIKGETLFEAGNYAGRNMNFGVREHGMGAILSGMALHKGIIPYGGTFLTFSDYERPAIRLAAMMGIRVIYVFTHDSIGLGEDGPTHQPIEQLAALRAIPGLTVIRPADANETAYAWRSALTNTKGPTALSFSRQNLPVLDQTKYASAAHAEQGGYVLSDCDGMPDVILMGAGSEVQIALSAQQALAEQGVKARVVSMPSTNIFDRQPQSYRDSVLLPGVRARVAIEAASPLTWYRYVGLDGAVIGLNHYGASAPYKKLYEKFGFTTENVVKHALTLIGSAHQQKTAESVAAVEKDTTQTMSTNPLVQLTALGQSPWIDFIRRSYMTNGDFKRLIDAGEIVGATSNPAIFEKAIGGNDDYDQQIVDLVRQGLTDPKKIFDELAITDIQMAADNLRPVFDRTNGADGYISLEVSPGAANDTESTIAEAHYLWDRVQRPNLMIKVPATSEGIPAIEQLIADGLNVNVTLIFALESYENAAYAYIKGLERRVSVGQPIDRSASVASFFVSRVDTEVDKRLDALIASSGDASQQEHLRGLQGKAAIANAKLAYEKYNKIFGSERFAALRAKGAHTQRCLWASTSTKNPKYRDVIYVEELIGPETVNTMPPATIDAFREHGVVQQTLAADLAAAHATLQQIEAAGISMTEVTQKLLVDGVRLFVEPYDALMASTAKKIAQLQQTSNI
jgi:transketolase